MERGKTTSPGFSGPLEEGGWEYYLPVMNFTMNSGW